MDHTQHVYTPSPEESLSESVVYAVAEAKDVDPMDLDERLYNCIDPDALDRLFPCQQTAGSLTFSMAGCRVEIEGARVILVTRRAEDSNATEAHA